MSGRGTWIAAVAAVVGGGFLLVTAIRLDTPVIEPPKPVVIYDAPPVSEAPVKVTDLPTLREDALIQGALGDIPEDVTAFYPVPADGNWQVYDYYRGSGKGLSPKDVYLYRDVSSGDAFVQEQMYENLSSPGTVYAYASRTYAKDNGRYAATHNRSTGGAESLPLVNHEVFITSEKQVYQSVLVKAKVTVEPVASQEITVPAGTFQTLRVRRSWNTGSLTSIEESWWAPEGLIARYIEVRASSKTLQTVMALAATGNETNPQALRPVISSRRAFLDLPSFDDPTPSP